MKEAASASALIVLLIFAVNPMHFWMPDSAHMMLLAALVGSFGALAVFILRERPRDEREEAHRAVAGHSAFLVGAGVLLVGVILQGLQGDADPWLGAALGAMVAVKVGAHLYADRYR